MRKIRLPDNIKKRLLDGDPEVGDIPIWIDEHPMSTTEVLHEINTSLKADLLEVAHEIGWQDYLLCTEVWANGVKYYISLHRDPEGCTFKLSRSYVSSDGLPVYEEGFYEETI